MKVLWLTRLEFSPNLGPRIAAMLSLEHKEQSTRFYLPGWLPRPLELEGEPDGIFLSVDGQSARGQRLAGAPTKGGMQLTCTLEFKTGDKYSLLLEYTVEEVPGVRPRPILARLPEEEPPPSEQVDVSLGMQDDNNVSSGVSIVDTPDPPMRYLVLPGNYSGDQWAVAAAMVLDDDLRVVIVTKRPSKKKGGLTLEITDQFNEFLKTLSVRNADQRVITSYLGPKIQQFGESQVAPQAQKAIRKDLPEKRESLCGWTFASSSVIMAAVEREGVASVLERLRARFAATQEEAGATFAGHLRTIERAGPCVLVNMRIGVQDNHPQHDMSKAIYDTILRCAKEAGIAVIRIGNYQDEKYTPGGKWMTQLNEPVIELFPSGKRAVRSHTAYFWSRVARLHDVVGVIGGRSGSLDVASLMGVRTYCWDIVDPTEHEYARQFLYFPFQSIGHRSAFTTKNFNKSASDGVYPGDIDRAPVRLWLGGLDVIPDHEKFNVDPMGLVSDVDGLMGQGAAENRRRLLMYELKYMEPFISEDASSSEEDVEEKQEDEQLEEPFGEDDGPDTDEELDDAVGGEPGSKMED